RGDKQIVRVRLEDETSAAAVPRASEPRAPGEVVRLVDGDVEVMSVAYSADGTRLAGGLKDGSLRVWDAKTLAELHRRETGAICCSVALSADGGHLLAGSGENLVLWDTASNAPLKTFSGHRDVVHGV